MIHIKTPSEIAAMRESGRILAEILHTLALATKAGMTTLELDVQAEALMAKYHVAPSFKGYRGYRHVLCISVNEEVVHGIPGPRIIKDGDIVTLDGGVIYKGFHSDAAVTILVGDVAPETRSFVMTVQKALEKGLGAIGPGAKTGDIGFAIQQYVESQGYSIVRDFVGHGIGKSLHEEPEVANFGKKGKGVLLVPGMTIAIEPIVNMGARFVDVLEDEWTAVTRDGSLACQVEHSLLITPTGYEVFTKYGDTINAIYPQ